MNRASLAVRATRLTLAEGLVATLMAVSQAGCSSETGSDPSEPPRDPPTSAAVRRSDGVSEFVVEGVSIFTGAPNGEQALATGVPEIQGDCLTLQGNLVVWSGSRLTEMERIVRTLVSGGAAPRISTGGGETDRVPDIIGERCGVDRVFLGGSE